MISLKKSLKIVLVIAGFLASSCSVWAKEGGLKDPQISPKIALEPSYDIKGEVREAGTLIKAKTGSFWGAFQDWVYERQLFIEAELVKEETEIREDILIPLQNNSIYQLFLRVKDLFGKKDK